MLYLTGDCHGDFTRFSRKRFPEQTRLHRESDFVVILGDGGLVWDGSREERYWLDWLADKPITVCNIGGNHENYELLEHFPLIPFHGGMARQIRQNIVHLERGYVYRLCGLTLFCFGGAESHDVERILPRSADPRLKQQLRKRGVSFREEGKTWFPQEMPSPLEYERARENLSACHAKVDLVLTHCLPTSLQPPGYPANALTDFLEELSGSLSYNAWFCGHYHASLRPAERFRVLYEEIIPIPESEVSHEL